MIIGIIIYIKKLIKLKMAKAPRDRNALIKCFAGQAIDRKNKRSLSIKKPLSLMGYTLFIFLLNEKL